MSYETRAQAVKEWVPKTAKILKSRENFMVYVWKGELRVLAIFLLGEGTVHQSWHVSVDVQLDLPKLTEIMEASI